MKSHTQAQAECWKRIRSWHMSMVCTKFKTWTDRGKIELVMRRCGLSGSSNKSNLTVPSHKRDMPSTIMQWISRFVLKYANNENICVNFDLCSKFLSNFLSSGYQHSGIAMQCYCGQSKRWDSIHTICVNSKTTRLLWYFAAKHLFELTPSNQ